MKISGKVAVVTGANGAVGRATALELARGGCHVLLSYRSNGENAESAAKEIRSLGVNAVTHCADVTDNDACLAMAKAAVNELGAIDILVNNAGTTRFIPHSDLDGVSIDDWHHIMDVNVIGPFQCIRAVMPHFSPDGGEVVNVSSVAGISLPGSSIPYGASKAALINMTSDLARALGPAVRINSIAPGFIDGEWLRDGLGEAFETTKEIVEKNSALQRVCQPEDIASSIVGLIAGTDQITGQTIVVDGGQSIGAKVS